MGTKATAQAIINQIADGEENTAEEVRAIGDVLLNELYPVPIYETDSANTITSRINININYGLNFTKQGNIITMQGSITVSAIGIIGAGTDLIAFTETEYAPTDSIVQNFKKDGAIFRLNDGKIKAITALTAGVTYYIDLAYVTD